MKPHRRHTPQRLRNAPHHAEKETLATTQSPLLNSAFESTCPQEHFVYALEDDAAPFYVGVTSDTCKRYIQHITGEGDSAKCQHIAGMKQHGYLPRLTVLYRTYSRVEAETKEAYYIDYLHALGAPLTNVTLNLQLTRAHATHACNDAAVHLCLEQKRERTRTRAAFLHEIGDTGRGCSFLCMVAIIVAHFALWMQLDTFPYATAAVLFFMVGAFAQAWSKKLAMKWSYPATRRKDLLW